MTNDGNQKKDTRPYVIGGIGCIGFLMLALCIPLSAIIAFESQSTALLLPLAVIASTAVTILIVWFSPARKDNSRENLATQKQLAETNERLTNLNERLANLNERLTNLEVIDNFDKRLAERKAAQQPTQQPGAQEAEIPPQPGMSRQGQAM